MDFKIEIKELDPLSDDVAQQNGREFFAKIVPTKSNSEAVLLEDGFDMAIKREIKSETPFPYFCSQEGRKCLSKHYLKQIKSETNTGSNNCDIDTKPELERILLSDFGSQNEREFLPEDPVMKVQKYSSGHEKDNKTEIKVEPCWLETETLSACNNTKDGDFPPVNSSRLYLESVSGDSSDKSPLPSTEVSQGETSFYGGKDCIEWEISGADVTEIPTLEEQCNDSGEMYSKAFIHTGKRRQTYEKSLIHVSHLNHHEFIQGAERPHRCKICGKSFIKLYHLKRHNLVHEGMKPHQCKTCDKSFTHLSSLKSHNLIHEGKRPHHCKTCNKNFTRLAHLKMHNLIHEGKKPHQCKTCDRNFTDLSNLRRHILIHEGKKPHQCKTCDKSFTQLSSLKRHSSIHEGKKAYQCETCGNRFTQLSGLKKHNLTHRGKKLPQC